jgi:TRAP-type C4-dicarboxylate transport system substrate-binding protein
MFKELVEERTEGRYVINIFPTTAWAPRRRSRRPPVGTIDLVVTSTTSRST